MLTDEVTKMSRYNGERSRYRPYFMDIALGIIVAGMITSLIEFTIGLGSFALVMKTIMPKTIKTADPKPYPIYKASQTQGWVKQMNEHILGETERNRKRIIESLPKTKEQIIREESKKVVMAAHAEVADFKAHYKKPEQCYNMKDQATRIWCANDFIRARKAWESQN
jgi:hypothetical protein